MLANFAGEVFNHVPRVAAWIVQEGGAVGWDPISLWKQMGIIGATARFVGLVGTVMGILNAFKGISEQKATGLGAGAGGISEALVTTAFGLLVAIPAVMMFNYLTGRVEAFDVEMDNSSSELIDYFLKRRGAVRR